MRNKLTSVLLSVLIAFGLWMYVVTTVSQEDEYTFYNIPVVVVGESVLHDNNLVITSQSAKSVSLRLSGNRGDLSKLDSSNISVRLDVSKIYEAGSHQVSFTPSYPANVASNAFVVETKTPGNITVNVEELRIKEVPVEINWVGAVPDGFMLDRENRTLDYTSVTVEGPASVADRIAKAVIEVDLDEQRESISQSYRYTLCDENGEPVDAEQITTNVAEVRLDVKIQQFREVALVLNVTYGGGATEKNTTIDIQPKTIRLSGGEAVLDAFGDSIVLGKINLAEIEKSQPFIYPISLPEGITNLSGVTEATVDIRFTGLSTKEFVVDNIQPINVPEGMMADIISEKLTVVIRGSSAELVNLTEEDILVTVDFTGAEVGTFTFKATITLPPEYPSAGALGNPSVSATVQLEPEE